MLKITKNVSVISLAFVGLSSQVLHFIEHNDHTVSMLDGTSAVGFLSEIHNEVSLAHDQNDAKLEEIERMIRLIKLALTRANPEQQAKLNGNLTQGRSFQEKFTALDDKFNTVIGEIGNLIIWAKKFGTVDFDRVKPIVEEAEAAGEKEVQDLLASLEDGMGTCCGFCQGDDEMKPAKAEIPQERFQSLFEQAKADSKQAKVPSSTIVEDFIKGMMGTLGGKVPQAFLEGLRKGLDAPVAGKNPPLEAIPKANKDSVERDLSEIFGENGPRVIRINSMEELEQLFGVASGKLKLVPIPQ